MTENQSASQIAVGDVYAAFQRDAGQTITNLMGRNAELTAYVEKLQGVLGEAQEALESSQSAYQHAAEQLEACATERDAFRKQRDVARESLASVAAENRFLREAQGTPEDPDAGQPVLPIERTDSGISRREVEESVGE